MIICVSRLACFNLMNWKLGWAREQWETNSCNSSSLIISISISYLAHISQLLDLPSLAPEDRVESSNY